MIRKVIKKTFCANHAVRLAAGKEKLHGHNWNMEVEFNVSNEIHSCNQLSGIVERLISPLEQSNLNEIRELRPFSASAEALVKYLFDTLAKNVAASTVEVTSVRVEEERGSWACYNNKRN